MARPNPSKARKLAGKADRALSRGNVVMAIHYLQAAERADTGDRSYGRELSRAKRRAIENGTG